MKEVSTTKMSSKGQVVIPEEIRDNLGLEPGVKFVVVGEGDTLILKIIEAPSANKLKGLFGKARVAAKKAKAKKSDVDAAIKKARK